MLGGYFTEYLLLVFDDSWSFCGKYTFSLFCPWLALA